MTWVLLIYTVPAQPPGKRASVWRDVKRCGAVYLRDGVCALPEREDTLATLRDIADKVDDFGGQATIARSVQLDDARSEAILAEARRMRGEEYTDLKQEIEGFLFHVRDESTRRRFSFSELEQLEADLGKLRRWSGQIGSRDFAREAGSSDVEALLGRCETELASFLEQAYEHEEVGK